LQVTASNAAKNAANNAAAAFMHELWPVWQHSALAGQPFFQFTMQMWCGDIAATKQMNTVHSPVCDAGTPHLSISGLWWALRASTEEQQTGDCTKQYKGPYDHHGHWSCTAGACCYMQLQWKLAAYVELGTTSDEQ
jgi:hypothetical protein